MARMPGSNPTDGRRHSAIGNRAEATGSDGTGASGAVFRGGGSNSCGLAAQSLAATEVREVILQTTEDFPHLRESPRTDAGILHACRRPRAPIPTAGWPPATSAGMA